MAKTKNKNDNGSSSLGCLIVLAILCLAALFLAFGWIAGAIWLLFFRKRMGKDPSTQKKYTIGVSIASVLSFMIFIYSMVSAPTPLTALSLSANINESELEINNDYTLHLQYEPDDASLSDITYKIDNPFRASIQTDPNDPASLILHTNLEGDINITAKKGDIESNVLSFTIIDSSKIKYEEAEQQTEDTNIKADKQVATTQETKYSSVSELELDELQQLYLNFDSSSSYSEAVDYVISSGLPYSEERYNGSRVIQVAFTEGCTAQKYMKESGDYLTIDYAYPKDENSLNDELDKYSFSSCKYVPLDSYLALVYTETATYISRLGTDLEMGASMTKEEQLLYYFNNK